MLSVGRDEIINIILFTENILLREPSHLLYSLGKLRTQWFKVKFVYWKNVNQMKLILYIGEARSVY